MGILQFDAAAKLTSEVSVTNGDWNRATRGEGSFKVKAPDEITLRTTGRQVLNFLTPDEKSIDEDGATADGKISTFHLRDGELIGKDGSTVDRTGLGPLFMGTKETSAPSSRKQSLNKNEAPQEV